MRGERKARPRFQRAFFEWYRREGANFAIPIHVGRRSDDFLTITFDGWSTLEANLSRTEMTIAVVHQGYCYDFLARVEVLPVRTRDGYRCTLCKVPQMFPDRSALWEDHLFRPLLDWTNRKLVLARTTAVFGTPGHATWATLVEKDQPSPEGSFSYLGRPERSLSRCLANAVAPDDTVPDDTVLGVADEFRDRALNGVERRLGNGSIHATAVDQQRVSGDLKGIVEFDDAIPAKHANGLVVEVTTAEHSDPVGDLKIGKLGRHGKLIQNRDATHLPAESLRVKQTSSKSATG